MNLIREFLHHDKCSYLENLNQTLHYKVIDNCSMECNHSLIEMGYRRFGKMYFRPICKDCDECKSIKIDVANFEWSKSKRRILRRAQDLHIVIQKPSITKQHLELFKKYHLYKQEKNGWEYHETTANNYFGSFVDGAYDYGYEVLYFKDEHLIGVDLIDILPNGISSIYFYYDPDFAKYNLGKLSLYYQIIMAKERGLDWIYLGYYVKDCPSLAYKSEYKPFKTLQGRPNNISEVIWR
ncbi:MAG: arginyltransferase [Epsilonproteobacteria bacterium]|nr:arginyltransferase [Campylobacterota bacterium]